MRSFHFNAGAKIEKIINENVIFFEIPLGIKSDEIHPNNRANLIGSFGHYWPNKTKLEIEDSVDSILTARQCNTGNLILVHSHLSSNASIVMVENTELDESTGTGYKIFKIFFSTVQSIAKEEISRIITSQIDNKNFKELESMNPYTALKETTRKYSIEEKIHKRSGDCENHAKNDLLRFIRKKFPANKLDLLVQNLFKQKNIFLTKTDRAHVECGFIDLTEVSQYGLEKDFQVLMSIQPDGDINRIVDELLKEKTKLNNLNNNQKCDDPRFKSNGLLILWPSSDITIDNINPIKKSGWNIWFGEDLVNEILASYDKLDDEIKAHLPLKRVWMLMDTE